MTIERVFDSIKLTEEQLERTKVIRKAASDFLVKIEGVINNSREKSIAITKIEEGVMWAIKSISHGSGEVVGYPSDNATKL